MKKHIALMLCTAVLGMTPGVAQAQDTEEVSIVEALQERLEEFFEENREDFDYDAYRAFMGELASEIDLAALTGDELMQLVSMGILTANEEVKAETSKYLETLSRTDDASGAEAAVTLFTMNVQSDPAILEPALRGALTHPGLQEALAEGKGAAMFYYMDSVDPSVLLKMVPELTALADLIHEALPAEAVGGLRGYLMTLNALDEALAAQRESVRKKLIDVTKVVAERTAAEAAEGDEGQTARRMADRLKGSVAFYEGAFARGELMNNKAPRIDFTWYSAEGGPATLADLRDKVVVLDFWATWCGPCIASFPNVKALQERYAGYDVEIIGVTSLQERHYPGDGPPVDCKDDPQKEYDLMREFMKSKEITWDIAFSTQEVFNPDFGVLGIPHVAIIGADGRVRYNGLHPSTPLKDKADKIDRLLKDAGLPAPAPVAEAKPVTE